MSDPDRLPRHSKLLSIAAHLPGMALRPEGQECTLLAAEHRAPRCPSVGMTMLERLIAFGRSAALLAALAALSFPGCGSEGSSGSGAGAGGTGGGCAEPCVPGSTCTIHPPLGSDAPSVICECSTAGKWCCDGGCAGSGGTNGTGGSGATGGSGGADAGTDVRCTPEPPAGDTRCGAATCGPGEICVAPCCGGVPMDGGCTPPPPYCADAREITCPRCDSNCRDRAGCFGFLRNGLLSCACA
jgi:hypothetical protein